MVCEDYHDSIVTYHLNVIPQGFNEYHPLMTLPH